MHGHDDFDDYDKNENSSNNKDGKTDKKSMKRKRRQAKKNFLVKINDKLNNNSNQSININKIDQQNGLNKKVFETKNRAINEDNFVTVTQKDEITFQMQNGNFHFTNIVLRLKSLT
jgi:cytochrome oxidase assembly protein ShyY1